MKLTDLGAEFFGAGGAGIFRADGQPMPGRTGCGLILMCPCGCGEMIAVHFANPIDGGAPLQPRPLWTRIGEALDSLTLRPSIHVSGERGCGWHGWITDGEVTNA